MSDIRTVTREYISPVLIVLGVVGNSFLLRLISRPSYRNNNTSLFIKFICAGDYVFLFLLLQRAVIVRLLASIRDNIIAEGFICRQLLYFQVLAPMLSAWYTSIMSVEKLLAVRLPLRSIGWFKRSRMRLVLIAVTVLFMCMCLPATFGQKVDFLTWVCPYYYEPVIQFIYFIQLVVTAMVPDIITSVSTIGTIMALRSSQRRRKDLVSDDRGAAKRDQTITVMSIILTITFVVFSAPHAIGYKLFELVADPTGKLADIPHHIKVTLDEVSQIWWMAGPALNSYVLILTSHRLRREFFAMVGGLRGRRRLSVDRCETGTKQTTAAASSSVVNEF